MSRLPLSLPEPDTHARIVVDFVNSEIERTGTRIISLVPLASKFHELKKIRVLSRAIMNLVRTYRWYVRPISPAALSYEFGQWAEIERLSTGEVVYYPDERWKPLGKKSRVTVPKRTHIFRDDPRKATVRYDVFQYLLGHRTAGTGVVNVETLYQRYGAKCVHRHFDALRKFHGFTITAAGAPRNFIVKRSINKPLNPYERLVYAATGALPRAQEEKEVIHFNVCEQCELPEYCTYKKRCDIENPSVKCPICNVINGHKMDCPSFGKKTE